MKYICKIITFLAMVWVTTGISKCKSVTHSIQHNRTSNDNTKSTFSIAALKKAIRKGNLKEIENEISKSSDPKKDLNIETTDLPSFALIRPLHIAISSRNKNPKKKDEYFKIIKSLLDKGADPCLPVKRCPLGSLIKYPLALATWNQDERVVKLLLDHGANVNQLDTYHDDDSAEYDGPIHIAMFRGKITILKMLLENPKIDVNKRTRRDLLPLQAGIYNNQIEAVKRLLADPRIDINKEGSARDTSLNDAVYFGCTEIVELLLEQKGIDIEHKNFRGRTPLAQAAHNGNVEIVKLLLKHGANPKAISIKNALLSKLGFGKHKEIKKLLKEAKENLEKKKELFPIFDATEADGKCSICLDKLVDTSEHKHAVALKCKHKFHLGCISEWAKKQKACPMCRANIE